MSDKSIVTAFKFTFFAQFLVGCAPLKIFKNGENLQITHRKIYDFCSKIIFVLIIPYVFYRYYILGSNVFGNNAILKFMTATYFSIVGSTIAVNFLFVRRETQSIVKLWKKMDDLERKLKENDIRISHWYIEWVSIRFLSIGYGSFTCYIIYLLVSQNFRDRFQGIVSYGFLHFVSMNYISMSCSFATLVRSISHMTKELTERIEKSLDGDDVQVLSNCMYLYQELYDLLKLITKVYAAPVLLTFTICFTFFTFQSYVIFSAIYNHNSYLKNALASSTWLVIILTEKFSTTIACSRCMARSTRLKQILGKYTTRRATNGLLMKQSMTLKRTLAKCSAMHSTSRDMSRELNAFGLQLLHETFEIHAGNMFLIDLPVFTSICGTATTYIVLLWQTDPGVDLNYSMKKVFGVY